MTTTTTTTTITTNVPTLFIMRGLPGSGKSTKARSLVESGRDIATDDFFHKDFDRSNPYEFDLDKIIDGSAHGWAQAKVKELLSDGTGKDVAIANTNTQRWQFQAYLDICEELGCNFEIVTIFDGGCSDEELFGRNDHGVPLATIQRMRNEWESDWESGNPIAPWDREK